MPQAPRLYLKLNNRSEFNVSDAGLLKASFDRFGNTANAESGILTEFDLVMFDASGTDFISEVTNASTITFSYGFVNDDLDAGRYNNMSPEYTLTINKLKTNWTHAGATISIGAIGAQNRVITEARVYLAGQRIKDIVLDIAQARNWNTEFVNIPEDLTLNDDIFKEEGMNDWEFLNTEVKSRCYTDGVVSGKSFKSWTVQLFTMGATTYLHFAPSDTPIKRRVWTYELGTTTNSQVIEFTSELDLSFLIKGLNVMVYGTDADLLVGSDRDAAEIAKRKAEELLAENYNTLFQKFENYNLPITLPKEIAFNITYVYSENIGNKSIEQTILEALDNAIQSIATVNITVVGNPNIMPHDLIRLNVKHSSGTTNLISATGDRSLWKVIKIQENIGLSGYTTSLTLAREMSYPET